MRRWVLALLVCASCDRLLGLEHIDSPPDAPDPKDDKGHVSGTYVQRWYEIAADSTTAVPQQRDYPASLLSGSVTLADGSPRELAIADGAFTFTTPAPGDPYSIHLLGQNGERTWNMTSTSPQLVERLTYPPTRQLAPTGTTLVLDISQRQPDGANTQEELITLGTWTRHKMPPPPNPISVDCSETDAYGAQVGMLVLHDTAYYTSTSLSVDGFYYRIAYSAKVADVATQAGVTTTLPSVTLSTQMLPLDRCALIFAHGLEEAAREEALIPNPITALSGHSWYVDADPSLEFALIDGLPLAYYGTTGTNVQAMYGNPYGLPSIDFMLATYALNAEGAAVASKVAVSAAASCPTQVELLDRQIELPMNVALGGTEILTMSQLVAVPHAGKIAVTWNPSPDGRADFYYVQVQRLLDPQHDPTKVIAVDQIVTSDHSVTVPVQDFVAADTYQIEIVSSLGYPNAPQGDFAAVGTMMGEAIFLTPPFRVTSP